MPPPSRAAVDSSGDLFIADYYNNRIREVDLATRIIGTVAGNGTRALSGDAGHATGAELNGPAGVAVDSTGDLFIVDRFNGVVRELDHATGIITTVAGNGIDGFGGDGGPATAAELYNPIAVAVDSSGDLFIADYWRIREVDQATGIIATVAGNGTEGYSGDGGPATAAELDYPTAVAVDSIGDLYIADSNNSRIREVDLATGVITTVAGNGTYGFGGDGGAATAAELKYPSGVAVDSSGDLLIADLFDSRIREVNHTSGIITTVAGDGTQGSSGDGGAATAAELAHPYGIAVSSSGELFIADQLNNRIREVDPATGVITTVAGNGTQGFSGDGGPATAAELDDPVGVAVNSSGDLFIADQDNQRIREVPSGVLVNVTPAPLTITADDKSKVYGAALPTLTVSYSGFVNGDTAASLATAPSLATTATMSSPVSGSPYAITASGAVDSNYTIRYVAGALTVTAAPTSITVSASANTAVYGQAVNLSADVSASPSSPSEGNVAFYDSDVLLATQPVTSGVATLDNVYLPVGTDLITASYSDANGNFAFSSTVVGPNSTIETVAGGGLGDGLPAVAEAIGNPSGVTVDALGDLFIAEPAQEVIREVDHVTGIIRAMDQTAPWAASAATAAPPPPRDSTTPQGVAVDSSGHLFIAGGERIREVDLATGIITTVAGNGTGGFSGDGGPATAAGLDPSGIAVDSSGHLFIADATNYRIREVDLATGVISTLAGNGYLGFSGDGEAATAAEVGTPAGVAVDSSGHLFIADNFNDRIREVDLTTGIITTVAGNSTGGFSGDGGPASAAELNDPLGVAVDSSGDLFIADWGNQRVREVDLPTGVVTTVAGGGTAGLLDGGPATAAEIANPEGVAVDSSGDLFIATEGRQDPGQ